MRAIFPLFPVLLHHASSFAENCHRERFEKLFVAVCLLISTSVGYSATGKTNLGAFQYLSPAPGSSLVSPANNIIIRPGELLDPGSVRSDVVLVVGTQSGIHPGQLLRSDDQKTLVFLPHEPFSAGERVTVAMNDWLRQSTGDRVPAVSFSFTVWKRDFPDTRSALDDILREDIGMSVDQRPRSLPFSSPGFRTLGCDTLPGNYPLISVDLLNNPDPGVLFISPFKPSIGGDLVILDNSGIPLFYREDPQIRGNFEAQANGTLTYAILDIKGLYRFYALDSSYAIVDSFSTGNGYLTDTHELVVLENGHSLLMSYDQQIINMDSLIEGGDTTATVTGLIIQELDASKNVVFQWRSWDHISILDGAVSGYVDLTSDHIDYIHGNAIEPDDDGNLLISSRHINEITKIDRLTGDIIWRFGLNALNNDFTFINDTRGFSHQHDIRRLPNGNVTLFDNGNFLDPEYSRALEYELDEQNMTATLVWEYREDPDIYGAFMGSLRRLETGGSLICWGGVFGAPAVIELHSDGSKAMQLSFPDTSWTYRAYRSPWQTNLFTTDQDSLLFGTVAPGDSTLQSLEVSNNSQDAVNITCLANAEPSFSVLSAPPIVIPPNSSIGLTVKFKPLASGEYWDRLYVRSVNDTQLVAHVVVLSGRTDSVTSVNNEETVPSHYSLYQNYPNPFNPATTIIFSLPKSGEVSLSVFNLLGEEVATLVSDIQNAGTQTVQWNATDQPSGVYFYRLRAGEFVETKKLVLLK